MHELFNQINIFRQWAEIRNAPYELGEWLHDDGEWECDYFEWGRIYELFEDFVTTSFETREAIGKSDGGNTK